MRSLVACQRTVPIQLMDLPAGVMKTYQSAIFQITTRAPFFSLAYLIFLAAWWPSGFSARFLSERRGFDPRSFHQGVRGLYFW